MSGILKLEKRPARLEEQTCDDVYHRGIEGAARYGEVGAGRAESGERQAKRTALRSRSEAGDSLGMCHDFAKTETLPVIEKGQLKREYEQLLADRQEEQLEIESLQRTVREKESCIGELRERCGVLEQKLSGRELTSELETNRLISKERAKWETREARLEQQLTRLQRDLDHSRREQESRLSLTSYESEEGEGGSNHVPAPGSMEGTSQGVGTEVSMMVSIVVSTCSGSKTPDMVQVVNSWKSPLVGGSSGLWLPISNCTNIADGVPPSHNMSHYPLQLQHNFLSFYMFPSVSHSFLPSSAV